MTAAQLEDPEGMALVAAIHERKRKATTTTAVITTTEYLDEIQARIDATSPGQWDAARGANANGTTYANSREEKAIFLAASLNDDKSPLWLVASEEVIPAATGDGPRAKANADFIAHARTDVPALLALVREQQARIIRVTALHVREVLAVHEGYGEEAWCPSCRVHWPCPTIAALTATEGDQCLSTDEGRQCPRRPAHGPVQGHAEGHIYAAEGA